MGQQSFPNLKFGLRLRTCFSWSMVWPSLWARYVCPSNALALAVRWCLWQAVNLQVVGSTQSNVDLFQANGGSGASPTHTLDLVWIIVGTGKGFAIRLVVFGQ